MFQKLCGENHLERVILTTTMWAEKESEEYKKAEVQESKLRDDYWEMMMKRGSNVRRFEGGQASAWSILDKLIENRKQSIRIRHELSRNWRDAPDTAAGRPLHGILVNIIEKQRDTLRLLVEEVAKATDLEIKEVLIKEWLALREEQKKAARNERRANSTLLTRVLSRLFRPGGKQVTPPFPYRDRCHDLISDILKNAEQRDKIACLPGPDAQMMFDFLVTVCSVVMRYTRRSLILYQSGSTQQAHFGNQRTTVHRISSSLFGQEYQATGIVGQSPRNRCNGTPPDEHLYPRA